MLDPKSQATLAALEDLFNAEYPVNQERPADQGPAIGRYAKDTYYGGNPWYLATLAAAEFYFKLAIALRSGAEMPVTSDNARFREHLGGELLRKPLSGVAIRSCVQFRPTRRRAEISRNSSIAQRAHRLRPNTSPGATPPSSPPPRAAARPSRPFETEVSAQLPQARRHDPLTKLASQPEGVADQHVGVEAGPA